MRLYFLDSWYFIALWDRFDQDHATACRIEDALSGFRGVTHDGVLTEVLAYFSGSGPFARQRVVASVRRAMRDFTVKPLDRDLFLRGLELYSRRIDKEYSHVDCVSMSLMTELGIRSVLTNDHHFQQEGFTVVNQ